MEASDSRSGSEAPPVGESGGSADLPQTAEVSNVDGLNSPGSAFAAFDEDQPVRAIETAEATVPSMGATSSPRSGRGEVGESGGSAHAPQDIHMPSMGATDSPRSAQDVVEVGEPGGSSHVHQDADAPNLQGSSSWFGDEAFQAGESGGSADLPQTAEGPGSAFAAFDEDQPVRTIETAEATVPSMGATSSPRSGRGEVGESGGSAHVPQDIHMPSMGATDSPRSAQDVVEVGESGGSSHVHQDADAPNLQGSSSWFGDEAFQAGESGGSADLPQTAEVSNVDGLNSPGSAFAAFDEDQPVRTIETAEATVPSMGATSSPRSGRGEVGESGGSAHVLQDIHMPSMGATDSPRSAQDVVEVGESGGSSHVHQDANAPNLQGSSSWFGDEAFQAGESGGSADLPQTAEVSNVDGLNSPGSAFADFDEDQPVRTMETAEATVPSMGATSSPRSGRGEVGESGGSAHVPQENHMPSMGATDSPRSAQDVVEVGESGGSSHVHQDANAPNLQGSSSWFGDEAFQAGESGGSADLPQTAEVSNVDGLNSPGSAFADFDEDQPVRTIETAEATVPSMGATSSPRSGRGEVGESGGSAHVPQDIHMPSMGATDSPRSAQDVVEVGESGGSSHVHQDANAPNLQGSSSWFGDEAFQAGESGGSADLPQTAEVSNVDGLNSPGSAFADFDEDQPVRTMETAEATVPSMGATSSPRSGRGEVGESGGSAHVPQENHMPSMGATDSPRSAQDVVEVGESGGSSHVHQDANAPNLQGSSSWFGEEAFQAGESGGSADLPQTAEVSNVDSLHSPGSAFADFDEDQPVRTIETVEVTVPSMGATSSPRSGRGEVGESGGSAHVPQDIHMPSMGATDSPRSAQDVVEVGESGGSSHVHQDANAPNLQGSSSWFGDQAGESGGSADLPQTAEVSNVDGLNGSESFFADFDEDQPVRTIETAEATIPSMGATSSPRSGRGEVGESGGSVHLSQDATSQPGDVGGPPSMDSSRLVSRGDVGGDPGGDRSFPTPATSSSWTHPGSGGSGGSGDRPSGYPLPSDPGATAADMELSGDEQRIDEQALPTGGSEREAGTEDDDDDFGDFEGNMTTAVSEQMENRELEDDDWEFAPVQNQVPRQDDHNKTVQKLVDDWLESLPELTGGDQMVTGDEQLSDWDSWLRSANIPAEAQELITSSQVPVVPFAKLGVKVSASNPPGAKVRDDFWKTLGKHLQLPSAKPEMPSSPTSDSPHELEVQSSAVTADKEAVVTSSGSMGDADWGLLETVGSAQSSQPNAQTTDVLSQALSSVGLDPAQPTPASAEVVLEPAAASKKKKGMTHKVKNFLAGLPDLKHLYSKSVVT